MLAGSSHALSPDITTLSCIPEETAPMRDEAGPGSELRLLGQHHQCDGIRFLPFCHHDPLQVQRLSPQAQAIISRYTTPPAGGSGGSSDEADGPAGPSDDGAAGATRTSDEANDDNGRIQASEGDQQEASASAELSSSCPLALAVVLSRALPWRVPDEADYRVLQGESEYASW